MAEEKYYIGRTSVYYGDDDSDDDFFVPDYWNWSNDPKELAGEVHELNQDGHDLLFEWIDDRSRGYNLCSGSAYGLAAIYDKEEIFEKLCNEEFSSKLSA